MKAKELREKAPEEIVHLLAGWREELFKLNVQAMTGQMEQYSRVGALRKDIARALTVLKGQPASGGAAAKEKQAS